MPKPSATPAAIPELTLEWIPLGMRTKMDRSRVRISLVQWQLLPLPQRQTLARLSVDPTTSDAEFVQALQRFLADAGAAPARAEDASRKPG